MKKPQYLFNYKGFMLLKWWSIHITELNQSHPNPNECQITFGYL